MCLKYTRKANVFLQCNRRAYTKEQVYISSLRLQVLNQSLMYRQHNLHACSAGVSMCIYSRGLGYPRTEEFPFISVLRQFSSTQAKWKDNRRYLYGHRSAKSRGYKHKRHGKWGQRNVRGV
jgi:hypothetical protein